MKVVIAAGGTGGHIYPALAIINKIKEKEPNSEFLYIGTHNRMEKDIIPPLGIPFKSIEIYGFNKRNLFKNFKTVKCLIKAYQNCKKWIKEFNPDIVIGAGGYVTVPVIIAGKKLGYKTLIHEQNSVPGKSNKFLQKYCDLTCLSFKSSEKYLTSGKTYLTGNPCSENALKVNAASKKELGLTLNKKLILIVMGSLGASTINKYLIDNLNNFQNKDYEIVWITGKNAYEKIIKNEIPQNIKVMPFFENLPRLMKVTDLMISRAGASTLSEIIALEVPSILIPSPYVANNHQYINALDLTSKNAAILLEEKDLKKDILVKKIDEVINSISLKEMQKNLKEFKVEGSGEIIYNKICELIKEG